MQAISHMTPAYLRVMRLVCRGWAEFAGRHTSVLKPEALEGMRLSQRFPHLRVLDLSHCQHMIIHPKAPPPPPPLPPSACVCYSTRLLAAVYIRAHT